jgi:hypothetical protein
MWVNREAFRLYIECKPFTLALRPRLNSELDRTRDLVRINDLESLAGPFRVFLGNQSAEPEKLLLDGVDA